MRAQGERRTSLAILAFLVGLVVVVVILVAGVVGSSFGELSERLENPTAAEVIR